MVVRLTLRGRVLAELLRRPADAEGVLAGILHEPEYGVTTVQEVGEELRALHRDRHVEVHAISGGVTIYRISDTGMAVLMMGAIRQR